MKYAKVNNIKLFPMKVLIEMHNNYKIYGVKREQNNIQIITLKCC